MLDIRRALEYLTEDPKVAEKLSLGAVITLAPILNLAAFGYEVEVARRVARGEPQPLPDWNDLGRWWTQGAWLGLAYFVYGLPIFGLTLCGMLTAFTAIVFSAQSDSSRSSAGLPVAGLFAGFIALIVLAVLYGLLLSLLRPAMLAQYTQRNTFRSCFDWAAMWRFIRQDPGQYALLWGAELALSVLISIPLFVVILVVSLLPLLGPLLVTVLAAVAGFVLLLFNGHLVGQLLLGRPQPST